MIKRWLRRWLGIVDIEKTLQPTTVNTQQHAIKEQAGAIKAMTPYERSLEDSKEIRERVEYLLK